MRKNALRLAGLPANVRAVAEPPTVTPAAVDAAIVPSATSSVTVTVGESMSVTNVTLAGQSRLPATSSVTVKVPGADRIGASLPLSTCTASGLVVTNTPSPACTTMS